MSQIEFQDKLLNLNPGGLESLAYLWREISLREEFTATFYQGTTVTAQGLAQIFQNKQVSQGSSNMVQVVDVVNNDGTKEKVAIRISKKNGYQSSLSSEEKQKILSWYTELEPRDSLKVRMELRDCAKKRRTTMATSQRLKEVVEKFSKKNYEKIQIEDGRQLKFLHYISQEIQSYINWNAPYKGKKYSPRIKIYAYKFINFNRNSRLCVIMQAGDLDLSQLYSCRKQKGPNLKFKPNDAAKEKLEAIRLETSTRLNPNNGEKFLDEIIWQQQDKNKNYSPMDLESSDPNIFNMTQLFEPDYLTSFDVLVAYKIFNAFDSQIDGLELLCTDIKPGNIVIVFDFFDEKIQEVVVNFDIFVIDIDSDWCDNIFWTDTATGTMKNQAKKKPQINN